jgi:chromate transporter
VEALIGNKSLNAALSAITAAVVGVILNLAVWFALRTLFAQVHETHWSVISLTIPVWTTIDWPALAIAAAAMLALFYLKVGMLPVLAASCLAGIVFHVAAGWH